MVENSRCAGNDHPVHQHVRKLSTLSLLNQTQFEQWMTWPCTILHALRPLAENYCKPKEQCNQYKH